LSGGEGIVNLRQGGKKSCNPLGGKNETGEPSCQAKEKFSVFKKNESKKWGGVKLGKSGAPGEGGRECYRRAPLPGALKKCRT